MSYVERCEHCECKLLPYGTRSSGKSARLVHYGSLTACGIIQAAKGAATARAVERDALAKRVEELETLLAKEKP